MTDSAPYQGKRLSAKEVLRLYAAGERNFRGAILRGCNFRRAYLSEADFTGADICSARFVDAKLQKANFSHAKAGLQRRWSIWKIFFVFLLVLSSSILLGVSGALIGYMLTSTSDRGVNQLAGIFATFGILGVFFLISQIGFTMKAMSYIAAVVATAFTVGIFISTNKPFVLPPVIVLAGFSALAAAVSFVSAFSFSVIGWNVFTVLTSFTILSAIAVSTDEVIEVAYWISCIIAFVLSSFLVHVVYQYQVHAKDPKFAGLHIVGLTFAALGGTTFSGSNLTGATFAHAVLNHSNFADSRQRSTVLTHVRWHKAEKLDFARLGNSNLQDTRVRNLLTTLNGVDQNLHNTDLRGANLAGAELHRINLRGANLNSALLTEAELHEANFSTANCVGADLTAAHLTGACLEAWNIDETTVLKDIDCHYVFLKEQPNALGWRERLPHNPDKCFEPGDFEKYLCEVLDEVKLLIRGGVDPQAFKVAFQALMRDHQITTEAVRGIQRKDADVLISVAAAADQPKPEIARTFENAYEKALPAATAQALLEAEQRSKAELIQLANKSIDSISSVLSNLTIQNTAMNQSNNPSDGDGSVYAGGDLNLSGSTLNLGEISGQVSNQISQTPDAPTDQPSLRDLLAQLKTAIDADAELDDAEKAEALQAVSRLATVGAEPDASDKKLGIAKRATNALKGIAETLTDTSKLATACETLLPTIMGLLGL